MDEQAEAVQATQNVAPDLLIYSGQISRMGYEAVCEQLPKKKSSKLLLILTTTGGDPHAGFRIARALQHTYESFDALVPWLCKSAGTLICIGASNLYLADQSELGPLDVQVKKHDELVGRNSGLDILQAVNYLQNQAMAAFRSYVVDLTSNAGLSTRVASDIASKLTTGLFSPIFGQIEPMRLAEMQRATDIAFAYGERLNEKSANLRREGLEKLVLSYPSHGFVIDRKEAGTIFSSVSRPEGLYQEVCKAVLNLSKPHFNDDPPTVQLVPVTPSEDKPEEHDDDHPNVPNPAAGSQGNGEGNTEVGGVSEQVEQLYAFATATASKG